MKLNFMANGEKMPRLPFFIDARKAVTGG